MSGKLLLLPILLLVGAVPVTQPSPQVQAEIWFAKTYGGQLKISRPAEKLALAKLLYERGKTELADPYRQGIMLRESRDVAVSLGDIDLACSAASAMGANKPADSLQLRADVLHSLAPRIANPAKATTFAETCLQTSDDAIAANEPSIAAKILALADTAGRQSHDPLLLSRIRDKENEVDLRLHDSDAVHRAEKKLANDPNDPVASSIVGKERCFVQLDWKKGLPLLQHCDDPLLQLAATKDAKADLGAADAWWDFAEHQTGPARLIARERAARLYEKNYTATPVTVRTRVQDRLIEYINSQFGGAFATFEDDPQLLGQSIGPHYVELVKSLEFNHFTIRTDNSKLKHIYALLGVSSAAANQAIEHVRLRIRLLCVDEQSIPHVLETWRTLKSTHSQNTIKITSAAIDSVKVLNAGGWIPRDAHLAVYVDNVAVWESVWQLPQQTCWFLDDSLIAH